MRNAIKNLSTYGFPFMVKYALSNYGISQKIKISYPDSNDYLYVEPDIIWKRIQRESWEKECFDILKKMDLKGKIIFNVGAWHGHYALFLSKKVGKDGMVYAFEPDPNARKILNSNIKKNKICNIEVLDLCVGEENGKSELRSPKFGGSGSTVLVNNTTNSWKKIPVDVVSIDSFCETNSIHVDGLVVDVEGVEGAVIRGAKKAINREGFFALIEFHGHLVEPQDRQKNWEEITHNATRLQILDTDQKEYDWNKNVNKIPEQLYFHLLINY